MKHGDMRNHHRETETDYSEFTTPHGKITLPTFSITQTVSERWCDVCGEWVTAKGIIGALLCVECSTPWKEEYRERCPACNDAMLLHNDGYRYCARCGLIPEGEES